jgi:hypothetical protein
MTPLISAQWILKMDSFSLWRPSVANYLEGKDIVAGTDLARAVGRSYDSMRFDDWRVLARCALSCGWKSKKFGRVKMWTSPDVSRRKEGVAA